jgi:hypothetical protein
MLFAWARHCQTPAQTKGIRFRLDRRSGTDSKQLAAHYPPTEQRGAPPLLARYTVYIAIHLHAGAVLQEQLGFPAGSHLRAVLAAIAME